MYNNSTPYSPFSNSVKRYSYHFEETGNNSQMGFPQNQSNCDGNMVLQRMECLERKVEELFNELYYVSTKIKMYEKYLKVDENEEFPRVLIVGANLQIIAKEDSHHANGLGNLIIGHNEKRLSTKINEDRTGCHNIIIGDQHHYTGNHSLLVGKKNIANGDGCFVSGFKNYCHNNFSAILGGYFNQVFHSGSCIIGNPLKIINLKK